MEIDTTEYPIRFDFGDTTVEDIAQREVYCHWYRMGHPLHRAVDLPYPFEKMDLSADNHPNGEGPHVCDTGSDCGSLVRPTLKEFDITNLVSYRDSVEEYGVEQHLRSGKEALESLGYEEKGRNDGQIPFSNGTLSVHWTHDYLAFETSKIEIPHFENAVKDYGDILTVFVSNVCREPEEEMVIKSFT